MNTKQSIAAFDFDGTITYRDSFFIFLLYTFGFLPSLLRFILLVPQLVGFLAGMISRKEVKEAVIARFLKGLPIENLQVLGEKFAREKLDTQLRPEAVARIKWHQERGDRCLLVSASPDLYLLPWAKRHGFEDVLSSRLAVDDEGKITGKLLGNNCRRGEKVRRLSEKLGSLTDYTLYAYGDSEGDKEMLEAANHPFYRKFPKA